MKISKKTLELLENFAGINKSIHVNETGYLKNVSAAKNIIGLSKIEEELPEFSIYDLTEFVGVIKMFDHNKDIEFVFGKDEVIIKQGKTKVNYRFCNPDHIYNKTKNYSDYNKDGEFKASFKLTDFELGNILKASRVMGLKTLNISLSSDSGEISLYDEDNNAANQYRVEFDGSGDCDVDLDVQLINFLKGDYDVFVFQHFTKFVNGDLIYILLNKKK